MERVAAVVVTFNRLEKLKRVIAAIEAQDHAPEWLVIVDNASTDGTGEYLATLKSKLQLEIVSLPTNTGGAGGFSTGMSAGYAAGADFVWIMDDDCYPNADALSKLVRGFSSAVDELGPDVPFACSVVEFIDGNICEMNNPAPTWDWARLMVKGQNSVMVKSCSFVSVLFPRWVLERFGLPYSEYFIWFDDHEYTLRVTGTCPGIQVMDSVAVHDMGDNKGVNFGMIDERNAWKFAYGIRNEGSFRLHHQSLLAYVMFVGRVNVMMHRGRVAGGLRWRMRKQLWKAIGFNPRIRYPEGAARPPQ
ncbi:glycosyltransferase family 2 protein [Agromyces sp. NPDC056379]|uniref:glycosyltransferase family 2 protein n=1 Tax=unclassified Agromyces TaxID=2639701 RepID=UPI0035E08F04